MGDAPGCLVLCGDAGIGKTTIWESALATAVLQGQYVLSARGNESETALSYAALGDLLDSAGPSAVHSLPVPQRRALEVAVRRAEPTGAIPDEFAAAAGFLGLIRDMSDVQPVLVAIDDVHWIDRSSADAFSFAARRLLAKSTGASRVRFLLTGRSRSSTLERAIERAMQPGRPSMIEVTKLSFGGVSRLLSERVPVTLPRRVARQVYETAQGNPLFALELGRLLAEQGIPEAGCSTVCGRLHGGSPPD